MPRVLNIAHRGGAGLWPENTLPAFLRAARAGYDGAELDVQLTRDGVLAVTHDFRPNRDLSRQPDGAWLASALPPIRGLSFAQLQSFTVGRPKPGSAYESSHPDLTPEDDVRIPTLAQVIAAIREFPNFQLFIEIKTSLDDPKLSASAVEVADATVALLRAENFSDRAVLIGFDWKGLIRAHIRAPEISFWFSTRPNQYPQTGAATGDSVVRIIKDAGGKGWFPHMSDATHGAIWAAHDAGISIGAWTVNDPVDMRALIARGIDAICSDYPDRLADTLK